MCNVSFLFPFFMKGVFFMTIKQKQCLLMFLGYYSGTIDGIWGDQSKAATLRFQQDQGFPPDDAFGAETEAKILEVVSTGGTADWWDGIEFFEKAEFACKCGRYCHGYPAEMDSTLVQTADRIRRYWGKPAIVSSGLRCSRHNANVGGVRNSRHLTGKAMDFCVPGKTAAALLELVQQQPEIRYAYAIDGQYVHMDVA